MSEIKKLTLQEWREIGISKFGEEIKQWKFQCVRCNQVQSFQEFIDAGIPEPENKFYFSCIGRWVKDRGCDWTLGGLFRLHSTEVISEDGKPVPVFEFAES